MSWTCSPSAFVGVILLYNTRLPLHAQVTARYLFPLYPLGVFCSRGSRRTQEPRDLWYTFLWTVAGTVLLGGR